jgi:hypothetical protein
LWRNPERVAGFECPEPGLATVLGFSPVLRDPLPFFRYSGFGSKMRQIWVVMDSPSIEELSLV